MTTAPPLARDVRPGPGLPHVTHETSALSSAFLSLAHEVLPGAVMVAAVVAGHGPAPMTGAAIVLALVSFGYAPLARTRHWAREHLVDLWAMLLLMAAMGAMRGMGGMAEVGDPAGVAAGGSAAMGGHTMGGAVLGVLSPVVPLGVVLAWVAARALLARRRWRIHSVVSAVVCGSGLLWMLAL